MVTRASVPLSDYEGHMRSAGVQQLDALSNLFADALACCGPESVAIPGIAGGNGLERIDGNITRRIVGLDVNPLYLEAVRRRFAAGYDLELHCVDLAEEIAQLEPVHLVHAALVFERVPSLRCRAWGPTSPSSTRCGSGRNSNTADSG